jgi:hypothetical protein
MNRTLPVKLLHLLNPFVPLFSRRVWPHVQVLLAGAILAPGKRTVSAALRVMGLGQTSPGQASSGGTSGETTTPGRTPPEPQTSLRACLVRFKRSELGRFPSSQQTLAR